MEGITPDGRPPIEFGQALPSEVVLVARIRIAAVFGALFTEID